ncbi:MBL fold metallo-hydrolase [Arcobacteraceae bacterium]|nr:MBL fold metallo-hydrolase [Arcobacteraceae bacterium]
MKIQIQPMGPYETNCYIATIDNKDFIIDPGVGATKWVLQNVTNPLAILNTHGHFDHIWSNDELSKKLEIPLYCPKDDCFMLENDPLGRGAPQSFPDFEMEHDQKIILEGIEITFHFFPGHTPGCSAIQIENNLFSGDFIFSGSIGRVDFPFSSPEDMKNSIHKVLAWKDDFNIYPGHGSRTTLLRERESLKSWLNYI